MKKIVLVFNDPNGKQNENAKAIESFLDTSHIASLQYRFKNTLLTGLSDIYKQVSHTSLFYFFFRFIVNSSVFCLLLIKYSEFLARIYRKKVSALHPDLLISTHPFTNSFVTSLGSLLHIPSAIQLSDLFVLEHPLRAKDPTYYLVPCKHIKNIIQKFGVKAKVVILPYPIHESFYAENESKESIYQKLSLESRYTVTISGGVDGTIPGKYIERIIAQTYNKANVCILCGANTKLYGRLFKYCLDAGMEHVRIFDDKVNVAHILQITDLHFMKSGTTALFETLAAYSVPYMYSSMQDEALSLNCLEKEGLGRYGNMEELIKMMFLSSDEIALYHENIARFLTEVELQKGPEYYSHFVENIFLNKFA